VDRNRPQIDLTLGGRLTERRSAVATDSRTAYRANPRNNIYAFNERFKVWWKTIQIVYTENGAVTNHDPAARIYQRSLSLLDGAGSRRAVHADGVAMKLINRSSQTA